MLNLRKRTDDQFSSMPATQSKNERVLPRSPSAERPAECFVLSRTHSVPTSTTFSSHETAEAGGSPIASGANIPNAAESDRKVKLVEEELHRVLKSRIFSKSSRLKRLLEYIITAWMAGDTSRLDGYNLAIAVFGRNESFEPGLDPIVRVQVLRLRNQLAHYYDGEGASDLLRIDIPKGSYIPNIYEQLGPGDAPQTLSDPLHTSVMVLPFIVVGDSESASGSHAIEISDQLIYLLTRSPGLRVTSRISSAHLDPTLDARQLGDRYGAEFIIEGTATMAANEYQVMVHLAETAHGYNVWSGRYIDQTKNVQDFVARVYRDLIQEIFNSSRSR